MPDIIPSNRVLLFYKIGIGIKYPLTVDMPLNKEIKLKQKKRLKRIKFSYLQTELKIVNVLYL